MISLFTTSETREIIFIFMKYFFLSIPMLKSRVKTRLPKAQPHSGLLSGAENITVRPNSTSTLLILTNGPNSQAPCNKINSTADPMMLSSMYHRQSTEVTLSQAPEISSFKMPFHPRAQTSSVHVNTHQNTT